MIAIPIPEAETKLADLVMQVERFDVPVYLLRSGHAVARIVSVRDVDRDISPDPVLGKIEIRGNLFDDSSSDWENA